MYVSLINTLFTKQEFAYISSMVSVAYIVERRFKSRALEIGIIS
jgi:hypothetical protein